MSRSIAVDMGWKVESTLLSLMQAKLHQGHSQGVKLEISKHYKDYS